MLCERSMIMTTPPHVALRLFRNRLKSIPEELHRPAALSLAHHVPPLHIQASSHTDRHIIYVNIHLNHQNEHGLS